MLKKLPLFFVGCKLHTDGRLIGYLARKVTKVAVGLFVLHVITNVPQADAGFALLALCMSVCTGATYGFGVMACAAACAASAAAPTP